MISRSQFERSVGQVLARRARVFDVVALGCAVGLMAAASVGGAQRPAPVAIVIRPSSARLVEAEESFSYEGIPYENLVTFIEEADKGSAAAKRHLGLVYSTGGGADDPNPSLGLQWFEAAAVAGDSRAPSYIGYYYLDKRNSKPDPAAALFWYEKARTAKDARGTLALADLYCNAVGVKRDVAR
jgi:TPR repeat protein